MERKANRVIHSHPSLISIDGADGLGKSTLSSSLSKAINSTSTHKAKSLLLRPTAFETSPAASEIGQRMKEANPTLELDSREHNEYYLLALQANYRYIRSLLDSGSTVVLDSSEIRALAFILDNGSDDAILQTKQMLASGELTNALFAKHRLILTASPDVVRLNLETRLTLDRGDPRNDAGIKARLGAYEDAVRYVGDLAVNPQPNWVYVSIEHTGPDLLDEYHRHLIYDVILPRITE